MIAIAHRNRAIDVEFVDVRDRLDDVIWQDELQARTVRGTINAHTREWNAVYSLLGLVDQLLPFLFG